MAFKLDFKIATKLLYLKLSLLHKIWPPKLLLMKQMHMEHLRDKDAFSELGLCFLELTQLNTDLVTKFRTLLSEYILQWLPWQLAAILEFKMATTESYISAYLSIQIS